MRYILLSVFLCMSCTETNSLLDSKPVVENIHGQNIKDLYRNAENLDDPEVKKWVDLQNLKSENALQDIQRISFLIEKQKEYDKKKSFSVTSLKVTPNDKHFYLKRFAKENVAKLYFRDSFDGNETLLYDPKSFAKEKDQEFLINYIQPNWDGSKIVASITEKGKEFSELIIIDVNTKKVLPEILTNSWASGVGGVSWLPDNSSFIYLFHPTTDKKSSSFLKNTKSVIYKVGDNKNSLKEIFSKDYSKNLSIDEADFPTVFLNDQGNKYLIGEKSGVGAYNDAYILTIDQLESKKWKLLFNKSDQVKDYIIKNDSIYYTSSKNAPNFEIRKTSIVNPNFDSAEIIVKEKKDTIITDFEITSEGLYYVTSKNGVKADLYEVKNGTEKIELPYVFGSIVLSRKGLNNPELYITTRGWLTPSRRYQYSIGSLMEKDLNPSIENDILKDIVVEETEVIANDGERIPLSLIYKKSMIKDGNNVAMMDGYGAYGISMVPFFSLRRLLWVMEGGVYAIAHVRGGGEKGDAWHKAGFKMTKPNTWKDFISCAEFLVDDKYTSPDHLAIWSGSAGGIMIGRAITEKPNLFKAAVVEFGVLNTLRSESRPNGANNVKEYGTIKDSLGFEALKEMDAYHHIRKGEKYPATLLTAGLNDPRVPAWFSVKFAAKMQAFNDSDNPNLLLIDSNTGHGKDNTKIKEFERYANILGFALWQTGHPDYQPKE